MDIQTFIETNYISAISLLLCHMLHSFMSVGKIPDRLTYSNYNTSV